ncbi:MAG TPA: hypothetical protein VJP79_08805 [Nitrososphaera sp.]|nr:hypothetical protein [Nitrososphaera sp.]
MVELIGPSPEEMKPGETYKVKEMDGKYYLERSDNTEAVVVHLPRNMAYLLKVYAAVLEETLEGMILQELDNVVDNIKDGYVIGEEVGAAYKQLFPEAKEPEPSPS